MKVLIVNAFLCPLGERATHGRGKSGWDFFQGLVKESLSDIATIPGAELFAHDPLDIVTCKAEGLEAANLLCDFDNVLANFGAKNASQLFDSMDLIFVGGDSATSPFDPRLTQLITLAYMASVTNKPMYVCGNAALTTMIAHTTQGTKWNILNGRGDDIQDLHRYKKYASTTGSFPSAFYDNETGDLYMYDDTTRAWVPNCCSGVRRISNSGKPVSPRLQSSAVHHTVDSHVRNTKYEVEALSVDLQVKAHINSKFSQHWAFADIEEASHASCFIVTSLGQWKLNSGAVRLPMQVLAETDGCPIITQMGYTLIMAAEVNNGRSVKNMKKIMTNFVHHILTVIVQDDKYELHRMNSGSLFRFVFCGGNDVLSRQPKCPPISKKRIETSLKQGPVKLDAPLLTKLTLEMDDRLSMQYTPLKMDNSNMNGTHRVSDGRALTSMLPQNPALHANKRLEMIIKSNGQTVKKNMEFLKDPQSLLHADDLSVGMSEAIADMYAGTFKASDLLQGGGLDASTLNSNLTGSPTIVPHEPSDKKESSSFRGVHFNNKSRAVSAIDSSNNVNNLIGTFKNSFCSDDSYTGSDGSTKLHLNINISDDSGPVSNDNTSSDLDKSKPKLHLNINTTTMTTIDAFLPHNSPRFATLDSASMSSMSPRRIQQKNTPYNTYKKIQKANATAEQKASKETFKGTYTEVYMSPRQKQIKDEFKNKKTKFIGKKNFISAFGKSKAIPLRKEGGIRAAGPYFDDQVDFVGVNVADRLTMKAENKSKNIAGHWKKC